MRRELSFLRGCSNISTIVPDDAPAVPPKPRLSLYCNFSPGGNRCGATWEADSFTPCPKCGQRRWVHKVDSPEAA